MDLGMSMMLKSFGVDTEQIQQAITQTVSAVQNISARMDSIEKRLGDIENNLATLNLSIIAERSHGNSIGSLERNSASGNGNGNSSGTSADSRS